MTLPLALVFHFNQHTNEYADIANRTCYCGLLQVLRQHPALKINLHLSGTLLRALPWFDTASLELVAGGLADGQFELLGSTYAQNVAYACDDWDNTQQIALHRQVLQDVFGVNPTVFWNSERCWRQSLIPLISAGGYDTTLVEDHILHAAGLVDPVPCSTHWNEQTLTAVYDDAILRDRFNYAVWFGRRAQLFQYLEQVAARPGSQEFLLAYAEDAEAMGLWGWQKGYLPQSAWSGLNALLTDLEQSQNYTATHLSAARARQTIPSLPDGAGQWMERALVDPQAPDHEAGFRDWFDFIERSPKIAYFRRLYAVVRLRLRASAAAQGGTGRSQRQRRVSAHFYRKAVETYCHHQYEYGCIGVGGRGYWGWENGRSAIMFARASELAAAPQAGQWLEDINNDNSDEQVLCNGRQLAVFSGYGGRLLYWFDLETGSEWVGNQLAVPSATYEPGTTKIPQPAAGPAGWLPDSYEATLKPWQGLRQKEAAPTRLGRELPGWIFEREPTALTVFVGPEANGDRRQPLNAQTGALAEYVVVDGVAAPSNDPLLDYRFESGGFVYLLFPAPDVFIEKRLTQTDGGVTAQYVVDNRDEVTHDVRIRSTHELAPDYDVVVRAGRACLAYDLHNGRSPTVTNLRTGTRLVVEPSIAWQEAECGVNLLALEVKLTFALEVAPRSQASFEIKLARHIGKPPAAAA